ncbi:MAG: ABC transporter permease [Lachnospiraceae bacterium]|nr:ABC transporter permease [Lachnospiraceae bacterium]
MTAIYKRELRACFHSFIGWLFLAVVLFLTGLYTTAYNLAQGSAYISYTLESSLIIFIVAIPILTMRILAEDRKNKTDQMILTAPVSVWKIVLGKYMALETVFAIPCAVLCLYPLLLGRYGDIPYAENYVALFGFFLYGSAVVAIGVFVSSLTESQVIAAVLSVVFIFIGYVMSGICSLISATGNIMTKMLSVYDLTSPFVDLLNGSLKISAIVYYLSVIFLMLFFTTQSIQKRRYSVSVKQLKKGAYSIGLIILTTAVLICVNVVLKQLPTEYTEFDVTKERLYSLTEESYKMMDALQEDITIYVLSPEGSMNLDVVETLNRYENYSKHIRVEYVDISSNPTFAAQYTDASVSSRSLIVVSDRRSKYIDANELYQMELSYETYGYEITGYDAEGQITSALSYVTMEDMPKVYLLDGHGESGLEEGFLSVLSKLNIEYETLNLLTAEEVPADAKGLIVNAPTADFSADDTEKIREYLNSGGDALFVYGYSEEKLPNYQSLLADYNVTIEAGMVVEQSMDYYYQNMLYLLPEVEYDEMTASVYDGYVFAPYAVGIVIDEDAEENGEVHYLLKTTENAFARTNPDEVTDGAKTEGDIDGPFALGARMTKQAGDGESTVVVYTSAAIFQDTADAIVSGNNKKLFESTVRSFATVENSVAVPVKSYFAGILTVPALDFFLVGILMVIAVPIGLLTAGLVIWLQRRKK